ncbi:hypothetical protein FOA52_015852 [Chlamydomonas sp. UWO 241]|nr:hypothetical protein FOA52_015852 [Chlamydomonas sp. UWO 241]
MSEGCLMSEGGCSDVAFQELSGSDLKAALEAMYDLRVEVGPDTLESLLLTASYLEMPALQDACCEYMRSALSLTTAVPLLELASRYGLLQLRSTLMSFICGRFSSLAYAMPAELLARGVLIPGAAARTDASACSSAAGSYHSVASSMDLYFANTPLHGVSPPAPLAAGPLGPGGRAAGSGGGGGGGAGGVSGGGGVSVGGGGASGSGGWGGRLGGTSGGGGGGGGSRGWGGQPGGSGSGGGGGGGGGGGWGSVAAAAASTEEQPGAQQQQQQQNQQQQTCGGVGSGCGGGGTGIPLAGLSKDLLLEVLQSDELSVECESLVLQVVLDWVAAQPSHRAQDLPELLGAVRATELPAHVSLTCHSPQHHDVLGHLTYLLEERSRGAGTCSSGASGDDNEGGGGGGSGGGGDGGGGGGARNHKAVHLLAVGGCDASWRSLRSAELYDPVADAWSPGPSLGTGVSFAGCATMQRRGEALLVGGTPLCSQVAQLSPTGVWDVCPNLSLPRAHAGVVSSGGLLFVLGGRSQVHAVQRVLSSVEVYQPGPCAVWHGMPDMGLPRSALTAAALGGWVYAIGGQTAKATQRTVEVFDTCAERWLTLSALMGSERKYTAAGVIANRLFVVGGVDEARNKLASIEAMDPREGKWSTVATMCAPRSSHAVCALAGKLYVVGGQANGASGVHDLVEVLDPAMNACRLCAPLGVARSGLGLCAL